jgi:flagellar hook-associated protein 1 FlgK
VAGAATTNTGTAQFTQPVVDASNQPPLNANLTSAVTITFTGANTFDVTGTGAGIPAVGVAYTSGGNISYNGWMFQIVGSPAIGDVFTIGANTGGTLDNRNALAMAGLQNNRTLVGGNTSLEGGYAALVGSVGNKTSEVAVNQKAQTNLLSQARLAQQSASGVNLDDEAANLIRYQQAYQAAAKMIQTANTMFEALLDL